MANSRVPVLGICYGLQLIVKHFGGRVGSEKIREDGQFEVTLDIKCPLFELMSVKEMALLTHGDSVLMVTQGYMYVIGIHVCNRYTCIRNR